MYGIMWGHFQTNVKKKQLEKTQVLSDCINIKLENMKSPAGNLTNQRLLGEGDRRWRGARESQRS